MSTRVSFAAADGHETFGELAVPEGEGRAPALVLVQEWWGVNDHIRSLAERLAREGFVVLAPDLYHGVTTKDPAEAARRMNELDTDKAVGELGGGISFLKTHPRSTGKVGILGFCMGGALSLATACSDAELSAVVAFYGLPAEGKADFAKVRAPILFHVGRKDAWVTVEKAEALKARLDARGKSIHVEFYDADHAFVNDTRPEVYSPESAKLAWERSVAFLRKHLAS